MKLYYGSKQTSSDKDTIYLDDANLGLPFGKTYFEKSMPFLENLTYEILNGKDVPQLFKFGNYSFWWFILQGFTYHIIDTINFIDRFQKFLNQKKPETIKVVGNFEKLQIIKQICEKQKISFSYSKLSFFNYYFSKWLKSIIRSNYYTKIMRNKFKKRLELFVSKSNTIPEFKNKLVIFSATVYRRKNFDFKKNEVVTREFLIEPLIPKFRQMNLDFVGIDVDYTFKGDTEILKQRLDESIDWIPLEAILQNPPSKKGLNSILNSYDKIISSSEFQNLFNFEGINFWNRIASDVTKATTLPYIPYFIHMIESIERHFENSKPKAVLIPYEKGSYALAMIIACKKLGIKTIGIQHGAFDSLGHNEYSYTYLQNEDKLFGMPIPDITLVWGNSAKKFLIKMGYPEKSIIVLGNPEFFDIDRINHDKNDLKKKYGIPLEKKIILFTTSKLQRGNMRDEKRAYDEYVLQELLKSFSNNSEYFVIVKPHPVREPTQIYEELIKNYNSKNFTIKQENILQLIQLSDVVISVESSTIIDAIALGKMVIEVTFSDSIWMDRNDAEKILILSDLTQLKSNILNIINDKQLHEKLQKNQHEFLFEHYNIPSKNISEILKSVINS